MSILRAGPLPFDALRQGLRIRLPRLRVLPYEPGSFEIAGKQDYAYIELIGTSEPGAPVDLEVILQDGRSYTRRFVTDADDPVRSVVTVLANTLTAIEEERVEPVRLDAKIPVLGPTAPTRERPGDVEPESKPEPSPPATPPWSLGASTRAGSLVGIAPERSFGGGALALDLMARAPVGAIVLAGFRWATREKDGFRLFRLRIELGAGYAWRRGSFELVTAAALLVEPSVLRDGDTVRYLEREDGARAGPLVGGLARLSPGLLLMPEAAPKLAVRLGLFAELSGSAFRDGGTGRVVTGSEAARDEVVRLGGLELATGADATFWFALRRR
jgi:hypothetical protein